ncbi:MFS transporter [Nocardia beijingensis]|uniref:MFS transporter n=1 Tax=Nocardia beijingensis TaxID=95162 RepID=UPI001894F072|nr:MFS transporter [Nocardia beijingensis]MBF6468511.1 MFS transporter [Nocardia beijingensis]
MTIDANTRPATSGRSNRLALTVIAAAQLLVVLDGTIVTVGLPRIGVGLGMDRSELGWVLTAYALSFGGLLLVGGRAGDLFGRRRMFRIGLGIFLVASLLGGVATNGAMLIVARAVQGIGSAFIAPAALSLLADTFAAGPARDRALGVYGAMGGLGSVIGLLLGGALTEYIGWRAILFINVPFALAVLAGARALMPGTRERGGLDLSGAVTATGGLAALVYAINQAGSHGLDDGRAILPGVLAAALLLMFVRVQRRSTAPMIPAAVVADRGRGAANSVMFLMGAGMLATFYFLTLYMQAVKQYPPMLTGLAYLPFALAIGIGSGAIGPKLLSGRSVRAVTLSGMLLAAGGTAWFGLLQPGQNPWLVLIPAQALAGVGLGLGFVTVTSSGVRGVAPQDAGIASGLVNTSQQIGGAVGLAALAALAAHLAGGAGAPMIEALTSGLLGAAALYLAATVPALMLPRSDI